MSSVHEISSSKNLTIHDFLDRPTKSPFSDSSVMRTHLFLETLERSCCESPTIKPLTRRATQELLTTRSNESILKRTVKIICTEAQVHGITSDRELSLTNLSALVEEIQFMKDLKWIEFYNSLQTSNPNLFGSLDLPEDFKENKSLVREIGINMNVWLTNQKNLLGRVSYLHLHLETNQTIPSAITALTNLQELNISRTRPHQILDFTAISFLLNLRVLSIRNLNIENIAFLQPLENLTELYMDVNSVSDLGPVAYLKKLKILQADNNRIEHINPLCSLPDLEVVSLSNNSITRVPSLRHLNQLKRIYLKNNKIKEAPELPQSLRDAWFNGNFITDPTPFLRCTHLLKLDLRLNCIINKTILNPLKKCTIKLDDNPRFLGPLTYNNQP